MLKKNINFALYKVYILCIKCYMANISRFIKAKKQISDFLKNTGTLSFSSEDLKSIFYNNRETWNLPNSMNSDLFIKHILKDIGLIKGDLILDEYDKDDDLPFGNQDVVYKSIYHFPKCPITDIALSAHSRAYLSHYSAFSFHNLTEQIPKNIYITIEQSKRPSNISILTQEGIDKAFHKPQRKSNLILKYNNYTITILKGKYTSELGVLQKYRVTNLERTMLDAVVRPAYCGGVSEVLKAFINSSQTNKFSANKLMMYLKKMDFIYPYHQSIGFFMEKSNSFKASQINLFHNLEKSYKFYLSYGMKDINYDDNWKIYYPSGM